MKGQVTIETLIAVLIYLGVIVLILSGLRGVISAAQSTTITFQGRIAVQHTILTTALYVFDSIDLASVGGVSNTGNSLYVISDPEYRINTSIYQTHIYIEPWDKEQEILTKTLNITQKRGAPI